MLGTHSTDSYIYECEQQRAAITLLPSPKRKSGRTLKWNKKRATKLWNRTMENCCWCHHPFPFICSGVRACYYYHPPALYGSHTWPVGVTLHPCPLKVFIQANTNTREHIWRPIKRRCMYRYTVVPLYRYNTSSHSLSHSTTVQTTYSRFCFHCDIIININILIIIAAIT